MTERQALALGCASSVVGVMTSTAFEETLGKGLIVCGVALALYGLHRLGRTGADPGTAPPPAGGSS